MMKGEHYGYGRLVLYLRGVEVQKAVNVTSTILYIGLCSSKCSLISSRCKSSKQKNAGSALLKNRKIDFFVFFGACLPIFEKCTKAIAHVFLVFLHFKSICTKKNFQ